MSVAAFMSLFMNNIAVATILLPVTSTVAKKADVKLSRLLMPLAFGTLLGGMATLFTITNIVVNSVLRSSGYRPFGVLDFAPVGLPLVFAGIIYMTLWGRRMLPAAPPAARSELIRKAESDLVLTYQLGERLFRARIPAGSYLINKSLTQSTLREKYGINVVAVERNDLMILAPAPDFELQRGDVMLLEGRFEEFRQRDVKPYLEILPVRTYKEHQLESASVVVVEVVLAPRSQLIGRTLKETQFRDKYGLTVLAVCNGERVIRPGLQDLRLVFGDALLLQGPRNRLPLLRLDTDLIVLSSEEDKVKEVSKKGWLAVAIFGMTILIAAVGPFSVGEVMLAGALAMVISNVLTMEQAYRVIEWKVIFLVGGMLPLGLAMTKTGATALFASLLTNLLKPFGPLVLLFALLTLTVLLSQAMKGAAMSAVIVPIAIQAAQQLALIPGR
jgi:di/tricarboxylate transporter